MQFIVFSVNIYQILTTVASRISQWERFFLFLVLDECKNLSLEIPRSVPCFLRECIELIFVNFSAESEIVDSRDDAGLFLALWYATRRVGEVMNYRIFSHSVVLAYISGGAGSPTFRGAPLFSDFPSTDLKKKVSTNLYLPKLYPTRNSSNLAEFCNDSEYY